MARPSMHDGTDSLAEFDQQVGTLLGSSSQTAAWKRPAQWAEELDDLAAGLAERLVSSGGRPTDPRWTVSRRVPFAAETWEALQRIADTLDAGGRSVAPAQLAATLVEERIAQIDDAINQSRKARRN